MCEIVKVEELAGERVACALSNGHAILNSKVYEIGNRLVEKFSVDFCVTSAFIESGFLAYSTSDSVILLDLMTHQSCMDPSHQGLERQLVLYRGIHPAVVLGLSKFVYVYLLQGIIVYNLEGTVICNLPSEAPLESSVFGSLIANRFNEKVGIFNVENPEDVFFLDVNAMCISRGTAILLGLDNRICNLRLETLIDNIPEEIISIYSDRNYTFLGLLHRIIIYFEYETVKNVEFGSAIKKFYFSERFCMADYWYEEKLDFFKIEYEEEYYSDFEKENEGSEESKAKDSVENEWESEKVEESQEKVFEVVGESGDGTFVNVAPSGELNVLLTFEPKSSLLNNLGPKSSKPIKNQKKSQDKPVTFHKKIKSSGYGSSQKPVKRSKNPQRSQTYPLTPPPPASSESDLPSKDFLLHNGPIFNIHYSKDGSKLLSCGGDSASYILKLPLSKYKGDRTALVGHEFQVNSASWSSDCAYALTTSNKYCCKLWGASGSKPGECLMTLPGGFSDGKFYYMDKFIMCINGNSIVFNRYKLRDPLCKDDVKRLKSKCVYKESLRLQQNGAQGITRLACHNGFYSHIVLAAGTNKVISVWDVDKQREVSEIQTVHRKAVHTLRFFVSSEFTDVDNDSVNLFLCSAADNYISLFDLRTGSKSVLFSGHVNTALELGSSISPCKQYLASGSEDRSAYIWDIRSCRVLTRLKGFKDVTNDVAWNPAFPQLGVAGNEGCVKFFN